MGRKSKGFVIVLRRGVYGVRWTLEGRRVERSTGERDRAAALRVAAQLYADACASREPRRVARRIVDGDLLALAAEWLAAVEGSYAPETIETWVSYARTHWAPAFGGRLARVLGDGAIATYGRERLRHVLRKTVLKELSALRGFLAWLHEQGRLATLPAFPELPRRAVGVRSGPQRERALALSPAEVAAFLEALPERMPRNGYPLRARMAFAYETGLRPATLDRLEVPRHWRPGARALDLTADVDKARFAREVPLSPRAVEILEGRARDVAKAAREAGKAPPSSWRPWGPVVARKHVLAAARAAGVPGAAVYDLRHARVTHDLEAGGDMIGVGYLVGHRQATTTSRYAHGTLRAAERVMDFRGPIPGTQGTRTEETMRTSEKNQGDRRGSNPRQPEPQSSGRDEATEKSRAYLGFDDAEARPSARVSGTVPVFEGGPFGAELAMYDWADRLTALGGDA